MKKVLMASLLAFPMSVFAGGVGVDMSSYSIAPAKSVVQRAPLANIDNVVQERSTVRSQQYVSARNERRSGTGFRAFSRGKNVHRFQGYRRTSGSTQVYQSTTSNQFWNTRTKMNRSWVTRTQDNNYDNTYNLATGLEPIDSTENKYRGMSREQVRQYNAKIKLMRMRSVR